MALSLIGQDIDETYGDLDILGQSIVSFKLNDETVWTKKALPGTISIDNTGVVEETGTAVGTVHKNADGDFLFTPPADLYSATVTAYGVGKFSTCTIIK